MLHYVLVVNKFTAASGNDDESRESEANQWSCGPEIQNNVLKEAKYLHRWGKQQSWVLILPEVIKKNNSFHVVIWSIVNTVSLEVDLHKQN